MGAQLTRGAVNSGAIPWLDLDTAALVREIVAEVVQHHPDLRAAILFGSVARHDERPFSDPEPSGVDVFLPFDLEPELRSLPDGRFMAIFRSIGRARDRRSHTPREVQVLVGVRDLSDWDPLFVANLAREGRVLWQLGPLPASLQQLDAHSVSAAVNSGR